MTAFRPMYDRLYMTSLCAAVLFLALTGFREVPAQTIRTHASEDSVSVGEQFDLYIIVERTGNYRVRLPGFGTEVTSLGDLEVIDERHRSSARRDDVITDSLVLTVASFALDEILVPPLTLSFVSGDDSTFVASGSFSIPVRSVVPEDAEDIEDLAPLADFSRSIWFWAFLASIAAVLAAMGWFLYRRWKLRNETPVEAPPRPPAPVRSPYREAMDRLSVLAGQTVESPREIRLFYIELTDIIRKYTFRTTGIPARELSSRELLDRLSLAQSRNHRLITEDDLFALRRILNVADLVKYADSIPSAAKIAETYDETSKVITGMEACRQDREKPATTNGLPYPGALYQP